MNIQEKLQQEFINTEFKGIEDMKQEVKRTIISSSQPTEQEEIINAVENPEVSENNPSSRVEIDDSDIPSFIKKLKSRF